MLGKAHGSMRREPVPLRARTRVAVVAVLLTAVSGVPAQPEAAPSVLDTSVWTLEWTMAAKSHRTDGPATTELGLFIEEDILWVFQGRAVLDKRSPGTAPVDVLRGADAALALANADERFASWEPDTKAQAGDPACPRYDEMSAEPTHDYQAIRIGAGEGVAPRVLERVNAYMKGADMLPLNGMPRLWVDAEEHKYWLQLNLWALGSMETADYKYIEERTTYTHQGVATTQRTEEEFPRSIADVFPRPDLSGAPDPNDFTLVARGAPLADGGPQAITGGVSYPAQWPNGVEGSVEITWACTPGPPDPVELVVKLEGRDGTSYDNWRPLGGAGPAAGTPGAERPGNHLNVSVALQARGGGATKRKAKEFRYELSQVSRLPGICCNIPSQPPAEPAPELRFIPEDNAPGLEILDEGLLASRRPDQAAVLDRAVLTAFDYGAHAQLLVTAVLDDGRRVIGRLEGQTAQGRTPSPSASRGRSSLRGGSRSTVSRA